MQSNRQTGVNINVYIGVYNVYAYKYYYLYAKQTRRTKRYNIPGNKSRQIDPGSLWRLQLKKQYFSLAFELNIRLRRAYIEFPICFEVDKYV